MRINQLNRLCACFSLFTAFGLFASCDQNAQKTASLPADLRKGSFAYDLDFLGRQDKIIVLRTKDGRSQLIISPKYQGKVFTSTAEGKQGQSFGWVNYKAFSGKANPHMNGYGGENRLWLGPEGGKFSLFFKPGSTMDFDHWKTPAAFDTEAWEVRARTDSGVSMRKTMQLENYAGTRLDIQIDRRILIQKGAEIISWLGIPLDSSVHVVAYQTDNILKNKGKTTWTDKTGMPCIWVLDMFKPGPSTVILLPFKKTPIADFAKVATTNYFGEIDASRIQHTEDHIYFRADGKSRGKLGIKPEKAEPVAGSYDALDKVLTIICFDLPAGSNYLNQEWNTSRPVFSGDAVNAYNDGPLADGSQMGPFYEMESVAPAALLKPGDSVAHRHSVFHFTGPEDKLDQIAQKVLGLSLQTVRQTHFLPE